MSAGDLYQGREQTQIKHIILRKYLERFALIIGSHWSTLTYVDCFSGPWQVQSDELKDTSFAIALNELRKAQATHRGKGKSLELRCLFLEKEHHAYQQLAQFAAGVKDVEVVTLNKALETAIDDVLGFVRHRGQKSFPFIFIDPTGWTGFGMKQIAPLLQLKPCEVLINFMTNYVRRFIDHPDEHTQQQFADLFGSTDYKARIKAITNPQEREDELLAAYAENVRKIGGFSHTCVAIILNPERDRSHFHLVYATRNRRGVEVFKEVEKQAMQVQAQTRADAKRRKREGQTRQKELYSGQDMPDERPIDILRSRYLVESKRRVLDLMAAGKPVAYESAWDQALSFPLVWESDLKEWIKEWTSEGSLRIDGMKPRQRVPKLKENNVLVWISH